MVNEKLDVTKQHALAAQSYPGLHKKQHDQHVKGGDSVPLLHSGEILPGCCIQLWDPYYCKAIEL